MNATNEIAIAAYVLICVLFICWLLRYLRNYTRSSRQSIDDDIRNPMV